MNLSPTKHKILISFLFLMLFVLEQDQLVSVCESAKEVAESTPEQMDADCEAKKIKNFLTGLSPLDRIVLFSYLAFATTVIYLLYSGK
jgi:hypothetical protein